MQTDDHRSCCQQHKAQHPEREYDSPACLYCILVLHATSDSGTIRRLFARKISCIVHLSPPFNLVSNLSHSFVKGCSKKQQTYYSLIKMINDVSSSILYDRVCEIELLWSAACEQKKVRKISVMKSEAITLKKGTSRGKHRWSGLRFRMTVSYALTTVAAVLVLEILFFTTIWAVLTFSPFADNGFIAGATQPAKVYALAAAAQAGGAALDPRTTFKPGQPFSIGLSKDYFSRQGQGYIQYLNSPSPAMQDAAFALLIPPDGHVLASSYPARYPLGTPVAQLLPNTSHLITNALAGTPEGAVEQSAQGRVVYAVVPVLSRGNQVIGAVVYVEVPGLTGGGIFPGFIGVVLISAVFWLLLMVPVALLFGLITTRGLVRRLHHLITATTQC